MAIQIPNDGDCSCFIVGNAFPELAGLGIISINIRISTDINVVDGVVLTGATTGDLSISAYAPLGTGEDLDCPGKASVSYNWERRLVCEDPGIIVAHFIPRAGTKAYEEGETSSQIRMTRYAPTTNIVLNASASSGPTAPIIYMRHYDGYDFYFDGSPIKINPSAGTNYMTLTVFEGIIEGIPSELYLQNFTWQYEPPNVPTVSYSFMFSIAQ